MKDTEERILNLQLFADDDAGSDTGGDDKGDDKGSDTGGDDKKDQKDQDSGDAGDSKDKKDDQDSGDAGDDKDKDDKDGDEKLFTADEVNSIVSKRLTRERKNWQEQLESEKKKAAMTEAERLKAEKEEAEKKATAATDRANQRLIRSEVIAHATKMDIVDPEAAYALMDKDGVEVEEDDSVKGVKEALDTLVKAKPYLVKTAEKEPKKKTGDDQGDDKGKKGGYSMNDLIRKAAGRV